MRLIPVYTWKRDLHRADLSRKSFMTQPWASGGTLLLCVIVAMLLANLPVVHEVYHRVLHMQVVIWLQNPFNGQIILFPEGMTVEGFINDILMVVFFFTVGLEIKREVVCGELSSTKKAMLPVIGAVGGMAVPAVIFVLFNHGTQAASGWGIPTATDIAFAVGIMSILGDRVPVAMKVFLTALAIADDLGAILVVAIFYGGKVNLLLLLIALILLAGVYVMNRLGEKRMAFYLIPAVVIWIFFYYAGIHATMSGVVMAFMIPMKPRFNRAYLHRKAEQYRHRLLFFEGYDTGEEEEFPNELQRHCLRRLSHINLNSMGMSYRLEHMLSPWVNFVIMPIFALANAGVEIPDLSYFNIFQWSPELGSVGMGVFFGLLLGKPIGITIASWIAIKSKLGAMPSGVKWSMFFAVACLGGIGFTMSIFVDTLSFGKLSPDEMLHLRSVGKIAVLLGSLCAGILGSLLIRLFSSAPAAAESSAPAAPAPVAPQRQSSAPATSEEYWKGAMHDTTVERINVRMSDKPFSVK